MLVSESITRLRYLLLDLDSTIFTDATIVRVWNEVQMELAGQSKLLEGVLDLPVPALAHFTYAHLWEEDYTARPSSLVYNVMSGYTYTQPWEVSAITGVSPQPTGGYTSTHMWEAFYANVQNRLFHYFPDDFIAPLFVAYDEKPIEWIVRKEAEGDDTTFKTKSGQRPFIYIEGKESNTFYLYPRVDGVYGVDELTSEYGEVAYDPDSVLNPSSDYGVIVFVSGEYLSSDFGAIVSYQGPDQAIHLIYSKLPAPVTAASQTIEWPIWAVKYIENGVLKRLYSMESDLQNQQLANFFGARYNFGLILIEQYKHRLATLRTYRFDSIEYNRRNRRLPKADLPSAYPSYWR